MPDVKVLEDGKVQVGDVTMTTDELASKLASASKPLDDQPVTFKVDGVSRTATVRELTGMASKAEGADKKFADAAEAIKVMEALKKMQASPDTVTGEDLDMIMRTAGVPAGERTKALQVLAAAEAQGGKGGNPETEPVALEALPPEVQAAVASTRALEEERFVRAAHALRTQIENNAKEALTKDPTLSKIIMADTDGKPVDWTKDGSAAAVLFAEAMDKVRSRHTERPSEAITPEVIQGIAQTMRARLEIFGKVLAPQQADVTALGPALGGSPNVQANEPVVRVPVTDPAHQDNFIARMKRMYQSALSSGKK